ncbi:hypothetical protein BC938DRAFT_473960 [Jimgerdemannia flammicorona]|nr:hypothetical protein BC938DRAFT_473960 [Jimgerdemannia flammicorona]
MSTYTAFPQATTVPPHPKAAAAASVHPLRPYYAPPQSQLYLPNGGSAPQYDDDDYEFLDSRAAAKELANFAVVKFLTTAVGSPFDVGKTLLQVQYVPSDDVEGMEGAEETAEEVIPENGGGNSGDGEVRF